MAPDPTDPAFPAPSAEVTEVAEGLMRAVFDASPDGIVVLASDGRLLAFNARFLDMWRFPPDMLARRDPAEMRLHTAAQLKEPQVYLGSIDALLKASHAGVVDEVGLLDERTFERHVSPVRLPQGPAGVVVRWHDITERRRAQRSLQSTQLRSAALFEHAISAILLADDQGRYVDANPAACRMLGYSHAELTALHVADVVVPGTLDVDLAWASFLDERQSRGRVRLRCKSGRVLVAQFSAVAHMQPGVHLSVLSDVTDEVQAQQRLQELATLLELAMMGADLAYWDVDLLTGEVSSVNGHWHRMLGYEAGEIGPRLRDWEVLVHPEDAARRSEAWAQHLAGHSPRYEVEMRMRHKGGYWLWILARGRVVERNAQGQPTRMVGTRADISHRKLTELRLTSEAHTDALTGVYNRRRFVELAEERLSQARRQGLQMALLMIDLDHFKSINDQHGHAVGDRVLRAFADAAQRVMRDGDVFARVGGEEFAALLCDTDAAGAWSLAQRLQECARALQVMVDEGPSATTVKVTVSVGVTVAGAGAGATLDSLLQQADHALYRAKAEGRDRAVRHEG